MTCDFMRHSEIPPPVHSNHESSTHKYTKSPHNDKINTKKCGHIVSGKKTISPTLSLPSMHLTSRTHTPIPPSSPSDSILTRSHKFLHQRLPTKKNPPHNSGGNAQDGLPSRKNYLLPINATNDMKFCKAINRTRIPEDGKTEAKIQVKGSIFKQFGNSLHGYSRRKPAAATPTASSSLLSPNSVSLDISKRKLPKNWSFEETSIDTRTDRNTKKTLVKEAEGVIPKFVKSSRPDCAKQRSYSLRKIQRPLQFPLQNSEDYYRYLCSYSFGTQDDSYKNYHAEDYLEDCKLYEKLCPTFSLQVLFEYALIQTPTVTS